MCPLPSQPIGLLTVKLPSSRSRGVEEPHRLRSAAVTAPFSLSTAKLFSTAEQPTRANKAAKINVLMSLVCNGCLMSAMGRKRTFVTIRSTDASTAPHRAARSGFRRDGA